MGGMTFPIAVCGRWWCPYVSRETQPLPRGRYPQVRNAVLRFTNGLPRLFVVTVLRRAQPPLQARHFRTSTAVAQQ